MESRKCLSCGDQLHGRKDQKFCSSYCRNNHHNALQEEHSEVVKHIHTILKRNRKILAELNPTGKCTVGSITLLEKGFNFNYFTNIYTTKKGLNYTFCYDQGYTRIDNQLCILVKKQEYVQ